MPTFREMSERYTRKNVNELLQDSSDAIMELTWDSDIPSKVCYIYDYFHDDQPDFNIGMTYENTTKTRIDAKVSITTYGSLAKDQPELHVMFKPSQKIYFDESDELYYAQERADKYSATDAFTGLYLDVPDKKGVYRKYLICLKDIENPMYQKWFILPCDYHLEWIRREGNKRIKQRMWCVLRSQSSYNSGLWSDNQTTTRENQELLFLPTNEISDSIWYLSEDNSNNQRLVVDVPNESNPIWTPNVWQVSKIERINVRGRTKVTLFQHEWNTNTDYIEKDEEGNIMGLWADYYSSNIDPIEKDTLPIDEILPPLDTGNYRCELSASSNSIKVGGSYKLIKLSVTDLDGLSITDEVSVDLEDWSAWIGEENITENITWLEQSSTNTIKLKIPNDLSYIGKVLTIKCEWFDCEVSINLDMVSL